MYLGTETNMPTNQPKPSIAPVRNCSLYLFFPFGMILFRLQVLVKAQCCIQASLILVKLLLRAQFYVGYCR